MYKKLRRWEIAGFLFTALAGPLLHFAYQWSGERRIVAAFSAVNESTWEHMKLLFVPVFLFSLLEMAVLAGRYRNLLAVKLAVTLAGLAAIPVLFYTYTGVLGQGCMAADIAMLDWNQLQYAGGCNDPVDCIVISGDARMVDLVMVNGTVTVRQGRLTLVDEAAKRDYANRVGRELLTKASVRIPGLQADLC